MHKKRTILITTTYIESNLPSNAVAAVQSTGCLLPGAVESPACKLPVFYCSGSSKMAVLRAIECVCFNGKVDVAFAPL